MRAGTASSKRLRGQAATPAYIADTVLHLNRLAERYREQPAATISSEDVEAALNEYIEQPFVHRRMYGAIHRIFRWARRTKLVANDPTADIETGAQRES